MQTKQIVGVNGQPFAPKDPDIFGYAAKVKVTFGAPQARIEVVQQGEDLRMCYANCVEIIQMQFVHDFAKKES